MLQFPISLFSRHIAPAPRRCSRMAGSMAALLDLLANDSSDVRLYFDDGQTVPGHSQVLQLWSGVLRTATEAEASSGRPFSSTDPLTIPLPGTTKEQWLAAAAFMYPLVPSAEASQYNLEALLVMGCKLDCPALLHKARTFVKTSSSFKPDLSMYSSSNAWKWIVNRLSDAGFNYSGCHQ